ncbi:19462_t:CDS:2 [Entrophospora sp. SA101]|nr:19462_t:CDS:2 [Entrophospora sp. SA101]
MNKLKSVELISDPITFKDQDQRVYNHVDLPVVTDQSPLC